MDMNRFDEQLDAWADEEAAAAERSKATGDERAHSIALMKKSMYSTMLKVLGHKSPGALQGCAADLEKRREKQAALGDIDSADRIRIQIDCISRVQKLIDEIGGRI